MAEHEAAGELANDAEFERQTRRRSLGPTEGARSLLVRGDLDGAIVQAKQARQFSPGYADPLELWGEALMLSGRHREARAQYEAARGMDLSKPDRAALNLLLARTASGPLHG